MSTKTNKTLRKTQSCPAVSSKLAELETLAELDWLLTSDALNQLDCVPVAVVDSKTQEVLL